MLSSYVSDRAEDMEPPCKCLDLQPTHVFSLKNQHHILYTETRIPQFACNPRQALTERKYSLA